jgi:predicted hotdog family 3-hydroxylacyl-ACP dehydratase
MKVERNDIFAYLPHRPPFVMVDNLVQASSEQFETSFLITADNMLVEDGFFQEAGLIENIAQSGALGFGFMDSEAGEGPKMGFIGAVSKLEVFELPPVNSVIRTVVTPTHQLGNIFLVKGANSLEGRKLLECEMKIVVN